MATSTTYAPSAITSGIREDLSDIITNIAPTDTVFMSNIGKTKIKNKYTEWLIDTLTTAANCAITEGNDASLTTIAAQTRTGNYTQISAKWFAISDTLEAVDKAGRKSEVAYQTSLFLKMLARDMEYGLINNTAASSTDPRQSMGLKGWVTSCAYLYTTGTASTTMTETNFNDMIEYIWKNGGNPGMVMTSSNVKRKISAFTGNSKITTNMDAENKKIILSVDYYESDFGVVKVYSSRFIAEDSNPAGGGNGSLSGAGYYSVFFLEKEKWQLGVLKPLVVEKLAKTGLATKVQMSTEYTLISRQQAASGRIARIAP
jgi:hypothetical protein